MPKKRAEYRLSPEAVRDLEAIWLYTVQEWSVEQAHRYIDELTALFEQIARSPDLGSGCDHIREGYRRRNVGRHVIYFRVTKHGISVIRLLHDRMDPPRHL